jgi:hypothetical protein
MRKDGTKQPSVQLELSLRLLNGNSLPTSGGWFPALVAVVLQTFTSFDLYLSRCVGETNDWIMFVEQDYLCMIHRDFLHCKHSS